MSDSRPVPQPSSSVVGRPGSRIDVRLLYGSCRVNHNGMIFKIHCLWNPDVLPSGCGPMSLRSSSAVSAELDADMTSGLLSHAAASASKRVVLASVIVIHEVMFSDDEPEIPKSCARYLTM